MKKQIFLSIALLAVSICYGYSFRLPVVFWDTPSVFASCTLGVEPGATDGYDLTFDFPAIPFTMVFDAQSVLEGSLTNLRNDIRSDTDTLHIWKIQFMNFTAPSITARWSRSMVPSDTLRHMSIAYGTLPDTTLAWIDMNTNDSLVVPVGYFCFIRLEQNVTPSPTDTIPPTISNWVPEDGDTGVSTTTTISFMAFDSGGIDTTLWNTKLWLDDSDVSWFCTRLPFAGGMQVIYTPFLPLTAGHTYTAIAQVQDFGSPPNVVADTITFTVGSSTPDSIFEVTVWAMLAGFPPPPSYSGTKITFTELGIWDTTEASGMVVFPTIPMGSYNIVATRDGYYTSGAFATIASDTTIMFALESDTTGGGGGLTIDGTVELEGTSDFSGSQVIALNTLDSTLYSVTTNSIGNYSISGLSPGLYKVTAAHDGYLPDSAYALMFFSDTTIYFTLERTETAQLIIIDWDNGDTPIPGGFGPAEALYNELSGRISDIAITSQDPNVSTMNLVGVTAVIVVTGNRLGVNTIIDNASLVALRDFVLGGGNIYWEGPDAGTDYSTGPPAAQDFFYLFGVDVVDQGESAVTGNVQSLQISTLFSIADTMPYYYRSEADHYVDVFSNITSTTVGFALNGPYTGAGFPRITRNTTAGTHRYLSSVYSTAISDDELRYSHIWSIIYDLLNLTDIPEKRLPREIDLISVNPNPFNASCRISAMGDVEIYSLNGQLVSRFIAINESRVETVWDARDLSGRELPSGVYLAVVRGDDGRILGGRQISVVR